MPLITARMKGEKQTLKRIIYFLPQKSGSFHFSKKRVVVLSVHSRFKVSSENIRHDSRKFQLNSMNFKLHIGRVFFWLQDIKCFPVRNDESKHVLANNVLLCLIRFDIYTLLNYASTSDNA